MLKQSLSMAVLLSVVAGCATPVAVNLPQAPSQIPTQQAAVPPAANVIKPATVPTKTALTTDKAPATTEKALATTEKALATTEKALAKAPVPTAKAVAQPEKALANPEKALVDAGKALGKTTYTLDDFDPMKALLSLPANVPSGPDLPDDDLEDESTGFRTQWLWGWWGTSGRDRGLRTFADEEGRVIEWLQYPSGWTAMRAVLLPAEVPGAVALAVSPEYNRVPTTYKFLPKTLGKQTTRHLKFFRRQNIVDAKSKHLMYYQVQKIGSSAISGYIARAEHKMDRYIAYYDAAGHFLWAYGTNYPLYGYTTSPTDPIAMVNNSAVAEDPLALAK